MLKRDQYRTPGFTIVELLIVIVVIAILAAITIISYNGISNRAKQSAAASAAQQAAKKVLNYSTDNAEQFPADLPLAGVKNDANTTFEYTFDNGSKSYCITATFQGVSYYVSNTAANPTPGVCSGHSGGVNGPWTGIAAGSEQTCGINSGKAYCWGYGSEGRLGNGSTANSNIPTQVTSTGVLAGKTLTAISSGLGHTCVIASGQAYCWGRNNSGQLGNSTSSNSLVPVAVDTSGVLAGKTVTSISAGTYFTCAVASGQAYCWGENTYGRLGNNSTTSSTVPVAVDTSGVLAGRTVTAVAAGAGSHACAAADGLAFCWGRGLYGRLGDGTTTTYYTPIAVTTGGVMGGKSVTAVSAHGSHSCSVASGQAICWGMNGTYGAMGVNDTANAAYVNPTAALTTGVLSGKIITDIAAGYEGVCVVASGQPVCWGSNAYGQVGNNSASTAFAPVAVDTTGVLSGKTVSKISQGWYQTCALAHGEVYCWGGGTYGQLGNNTTANSPIPVKVTNP